MKKKKEKIEEESADLYIAMAALCYKYYVALAKEICEEFIPSRKNLKILDIGTGPGFLPLEIAVLRPRAKICGIDLTKKMIEYASKFVKTSRRTGKRKRKGEQLYFCLADTNRLPFLDNSFDIVISTGVLHALSKPTRVLNECYRVLKPGKQLVIYDPARPYFYIDKDLWEELLDKLLLKHKKSRRKSILPRSYSIEEAVKIIERSSFKAAEQIQKNEAQDYLKIVLRK